MSSAVEKGSIIIRDITLRSEMREVENLQKAVWQTDDRDVVPLNILAATGEVGAILLGAFDGPAPVGFAYSFVGRENELPVHHSHMVRRKFVVQALEQPGFKIYDSGSAFYVWARLPEGFEDATSFNEMLIERGGVAGVPGSAFADRDEWNNYMRLCIAREDGVLQSALDRLMQTSSA